RWEARPLRAPRAICVSGSVVSRGGAVAARWAHTPKVGGSKPRPATSTPVPRIVRPVPPRHGAFVVNPPSNLRNHAPPKGGASVVKGYGQRTSLEQRHLLGGLLLPCDGSVGRGLDQREGGVELGP